jgi:hypothetical protein
MFDMRTARLRKSLLAALVLGLAATAAVTLPAVADETTMGSGALRSNWDADEPGLTSNAAQQPDFGQLWSVKLPGTTTATPNQVYAQPLVATVGGQTEVIVATEENQVDALDPKTGHLLWTRSLGPVSLPPANCANLAPHIGITSTPVIDPATGTIYVIAAVGRTPDATQTNMYVHALSFANGHEINSNWPLLISGNATNARAGATVAFNGTTANQRVGLLLDGGAIYFGTASHCDHAPYVGFVGRVTTPATGKPSLKLWAAESQTADDEAGIWQSGGALMSDGPGRIFAVTGNGVSPSPGKGTSPPGTLGESVVRLAVNSDGSMVAKDYFSPANNNKLDQDDADLGAGNPVALPASFGSTAHPHLMVVAGKNGVVWLLDRDNLGGTAQGPGGTDAVVSSTTIPGVWGRSAAFDGGTAGNYIYLQPSYAPLQALTVAPNTSGVPTLAVAGTGSQSFGFSSGSPVVTSDGNDASTALVWIAVCKDGSGADAQLLAYPAIPPSGKPWKPVVSYPLGNIAKFIQPATDGGRVYVGTQDGRILAFGRPTTGAVSSPSTDFGLHPVDDLPTSRNVTLTANAPVTINSVSTAAPFAVAAGGPTFPQHLASGDTLDVPVSFTASTPGTVSGVLTVSATPDADPPAKTYPFSLSGTGTAPGILPNPTSVDFGKVSLGQAAQPSVTFQNTGTESVTVTGANVTDPTHNGITLVGEPPASYVVAPQGSVTVKVQFEPTKAATATGTLTVTAKDTDDPDEPDDQYTAHVALTGVGFTGVPRLLLTGPLVVPGLLKFGSVLPGKKVTTTLRIANVGTAAMVVNKAPSPAPPFSVPFSGEGAIVQPGDSLVISFTVTPTTSEPAHQTYSITVNDGHGPHLLPMSVNTAAPVGPIPGAFGCVTLKLLKVVNDTPILNYPCNGSRAQNWSFGPKGTITFGGSFCLDTQGGHTANNTPVELFRCNNTTAQFWTVANSGRLVNQRAKRCLDINGRSSEPNARLVITNCSVSPTQQWDTGTQNHAYGLVSSGLGALNQQCMTAPDVPPRPGTPIDLRPCTSAPGQLVAHTNSTLRLSGGCVTLSQPSAKAAVFIAQCSGSVTQTWVVGNHRQLYNPASRLCIDVPDAGKNPSAHLWAYACNYTSSQVWRLPG